MEKKIKFIKEIVKNCGFVLLGSQCGRYHAVYYDASRDDYEVIAFTRCGCKEVISLSDITSRKAINNIYADLMVDFGD